jgi:CheY-like chemotaxis protein
MDFIFNHLVPLEESLTCEFKEVPPGNNSFKAISSIADEYVVGFLNESGGSIYWGINDDRKVTGVKINPHTLMEIKTTVGQKIAGIAPQIPPGSYDLPVHKILVGPDKSDEINDLFVIEIHVEKPSNQMLYLTEKGEAYRRTLGGTVKLNANALLAALTEQLQKKIVNSPDYTEIDNPLVEEMPSVITRAHVVRPLVRGSRILWVDDRPSSNMYERRFLLSLGVQIDQATSSEEAIYLLKSSPYNLVISDMERYGDSSAGLKMLEQIKRLRRNHPVIFYVAFLNKRRGVPEGAFAITNRPDDLLHSVLDILER